jgi:hypothetical protein
LRRSDQAVQITVRLKRKADRGALVEIVNSLSGDMPGKTHSSPPMSMTTSTGLYEQLLTAFQFQQIGGNAGPRDLRSYRSAACFGSRNWTRPKIRRPRRPDDIAGV